ncbi:MAG: PilZ domain-containing protein [Sphingobium phenoxybenzoativorans]|uniref:PilZ domain-containing protein n=1 Tax=Sphingobium phenoxybenzoativorans TaxID=1592790 RepID=A0A975K4Z2_9SPHN|nr:PilZ domain-containing protein [Sphingobium phenoxybenzoativorans]QUT04936.1 PilZ domain-containing protein [Sphingobium phenoxybenzoativorans]
MGTELEDSDERGPARIAPRDSLFLLTSLTTLQGASLGKARIRNLSATGMMADCEAALAKGQQVIMDLRGVGQVFGKIAWTRNDRVGIVFDQAIDPQLARKPVAEGRGSHKMPDYLRMTGKTLRR